MTINMPDSIRPGDLPAGYPAYLGYADGIWATAAVLKVQHPAAHIVSLTVLNDTLEADGVDCEPGNGNAKSAAAWVQRKLAAAPVTRPVVYASLAAPGYSMPEIVADLTALGIARSRVRLLTAHYGLGEHICGPATCGGLRFTADGTQWTDQYRTPAGAVIDMSLLSDSFFGTPAAPVPQTTEVDVQLPVLTQGSSGQAVQNWQGLLVAHAYGYLLGGAVVGNVMQQAGVDGNFGPNTTAATVKFQQDHGLTGDGVVGTKTWAAALGS